LYGSPPSLGARWGTSPGAPAGPRSSRAAPALCSRTSPTRSKWRSKVCEAMSRLAAPAFSTPWSSRVSPQSCWPKCSAKAGNGCRAGRALAGIVLRLSTRTTGSRKAATPYRCPANQEITRRRIAVSKARTFRRTLGLVVALGAVGWSIAHAADVSFQPPQWELGERNDGGYYTLVTPAGERVTETAVIVDVGDQYIDEENRIFEVVEVRGDEVVVEEKGTAEMPDVRDALDALEVSRRGSGSALSAFARWLGAQAGGGGANQTIGIYHTHNAESYVPTSGTDSKEYGDIHRVGQALKDAFENMGYRVIWKDDSHLPHDGEAYLRSRRTAAEISRERPVTILDVHR